MKLMRFIAIGLTLGILGFGLAAPTLAAAAEGPVVTILGKASPIQLDLGQNLIQVEIKDDVGIAQVRFDTLGYSGPMTLNKNTGLYEVTLNTTGLNCRFDSLNVFAMDFKGRVGTDRAILDNHVWCNSR